MCFPPNVVGHILNGKSVARAVRAHVLVLAVLHAIITSAAFNTPLGTPEKDGQNDQDLPCDTVHSQLTTNQDVDDNLVKTLQTFDDVLEVMLQLTRFTRVTI